MPLSSAPRGLCSWLPGFPWGLAVSDLCFFPLLTLSGPVQIQIPTHWVLCGPWTKVLHSAEPFPHRAAEMMLVSIFRVEREVSMAYKAHFAWQWWQANSWAGWVSGLDQQCGLWTSQAIYEKKNGEDTNPSEPKGILYDSHHMIICYISMEVSCNYIGSGSCWV